MKKPGLSRAGQGVNMFLLWDVPVIADYDLDVYSTVRIVAAEYLVLLDIHRVYQELHGVGVAGVVDDLGIWHQVGVAHLSDVNSLTDQIFLCGPGQAGSGCAVVDCHAGVFLGNQLRGIDAEDHGAGSSLSSEDVIPQHADVFGDRFEYLLCAVRGSVQRDHVRWGDHAVLDVVDIDLLSEQAQLKDLIVGHVGADAARQVGEDGRAVGGDV